MVAPSNRVRVRSYPGIGTLPCQDPVSITRNIMRRTLLIALGATALTVGWLGLLPVALGQVPFGPHAEGETPPRFPDFNTVVKGAKEYDGLFKLYHKDDRVHLEI